jgi:hypothetical protein
MVRYIEDETIADVLELNGRVAPPELLNRRTRTGANAVRLEQSLRAKDEELVFVYARRTDRSLCDRAPRSTLEVVTSIELEREAARTAPAAVRMRTPLPARCVSFLSAETKKLRSTCLGTRAGVVQLD